MKTGGNDAPLAIPAALLAQIRATADAENRTADEVLPDIIEGGLEERRWKALARRDSQRARALGLVHDDPVGTGEDQATLRAKIGAGMASLRAGGSTDGEAFMAQMDADPAEIERQGG